MDASSAAAAEAGVFAADFSSENLSSEKPCIRPIFWVPMVFVLTVVGSLWITQGDNPIPRPAGWDQVSHNGIQIVGSPRYLKQVREALDLLKAKAPEELALVAEFVSVIEEGDRSGMWADRDPPTYVMSETTAFYSITWCAGTIVHDSYHSAMYHRYLREHGTPVPRKVWTGQLAEQTCNARQMKALKKIGAPKHEIEHLSSMDGTHYDLDGDGVETWNDYRLRDW